MSCRSWQELLAQQASPAAASIVIPAHDQVEPQCKTSGFAALLIKHDFGVSVHSPLSIDGLLVSARAASSCWHPLQCSAAILPPGRVVQAHNHGPHSSGSRVVELQTDAEFNKAMSQPDRLKVLDYTASWSVIWCCPACLQTVWLRR